MFGLRKCKLATGAIISLSCLTFLARSPKIMAQGNFVIGTFWAPSDTAYYHQVRDCGMNFIQQPTISEGELVAAERYGFLYTASDPDGGLYASGQSSLYQAETQFSIGTGGLVNDPDAYPSGGDLNAVQAIAGVHSPEYLIHDLHTYN